MDDMESEHGMRLQLESRTREDFRKITAQAERSARRENAFWLCILAVGSMSIGALAFWAIANATGVCL